jgi:hypothetical protein
MAFWWGRAGASTTARHTPRPVVPPPARGRPVRRWPRVLVGTARRCWFGAFPDPSWCDPFQIGASLGVKSALPASSSASRGGVRGGGGGSARAAGGGGAWGWVRQARHARMRYLHVVARAGWASFVRKRVAMEHAGNAWTHTGCGEGSPAGAAAEVLSGGLPAVGRLRRGCGGFAAVGAAEVLPGGLPAVGRLRRGWGG